VLGEEERAGLYAVDRQRSDEYGDARLARDAESQHRRQRTGNARILGGFGGDHSAGLMRSTCSDASSMYFFISSLLITAAAPALTDLLGEQVQVFATMAS